MKTIKGSIPGQCFPIMCFLINITIALVYMLLLLRLIIKVEFILVPLY